jgi:hypothetical protein
MAGVRLADGIDEHRVHIAAVPQDMGKAVALLAPRSYQFPVLPMR